MSETNSEPDYLKIGELMTLPELAELTGFSRKFLSELALSGKLKAKKSGSSWLTTQAAWEHYFRNRSMKNVPIKYRDRNKPNGGDTNNE